MSYVSRRCSSIVCLPVTLACLLPSTPVAAEEPLAFYGVPLDQDYREADERLLKYLAPRLGVGLEQKQPGTYSALIRELVDRGDGIHTKGEDTTAPYLARMTPYAYVAAQMMGASFEPLATYESKATDSTTYHSYFVVNRLEFPAHSEANPPELRDLHEYLRSRVGRPVFLYHDKFSTSSYFLPALWFRSQQIFDMSQPMKPLIAIEAKKAPAGASSTDLVKQVAEGKVNLAAVWDGTRAKFDPLGAPLYEQFGNKVFFIQLPDVLPNDLLVCATWLSDECKKKTTEAIRAMKEADWPLAGDFKWWTPIGGAQPARVALANLGVRASAPAAPVTVKIEADAKYLADMRRALRLSGTEFVEFNPDLPHKHQDVRWELREIHDGALELLTSMPDMGPKKEKELQQRFPISLSGADGELTNRVMELIRSRMNRIRYIWPYEERDPTIIRDVDFAVRAGAVLCVQRIEWLDPEHDDFTWEPPIEAKVVEPTFSKFKLEGEKLEDFDNPMSNIAFRVVLARPTIESATMKMMTVVLLVLLVVAAGGAAFDLRRKTAQPGRAEVGTTVAGACAELVTAYHAPWRGRELAEADVLWCDRDQIEQLIEELKVQGVGLELGETERRQRTWRASAMWSFKGLGGGVDRSRATDLVIDRAKVGDASRLAALLKLMVERHLFSGFVGRPLEAEALNRLVRNTLRAEGATDTTAAGTELLRTDSALVTELVSEHFNEVLDGSRQKLSFFKGAWVVAERDERYLGARQVPLSSTLCIGTDRRLVHGLVLEFELPAPSEGLVVRDGAELECWLLGKVVRLSYIVREATPWLCLHFRALAGLADTAAGRAVA